MEKYLNKIINADCLDILKELDDNCVDLVLTDPPYGIGMDGNAGNSTEYEQKDWDRSTPPPEVFEQIIRVSKNAIIFGGNYFPLPLVKSWLIWDKRCGVIPERTYADCEMAWTNINTPARIIRFIWDGMLQQDMKNKEERIHPTQKPRQLFMQILEKYLEKIDIDCPILGRRPPLILDPFSGSGTLALAAHDLGFFYICIEKDPDYHKASVARLKAHQRQLKLF